MPSEATVVGPEWLRGEAFPLASEGQFEAHGWEDLALDHPQQFGASLTELGLPGDAVERGMRVRDEAAADVDREIAAFWNVHPLKYFETPPEVAAEVNLIYNSARKSAADRLRDLFARRRIDVEDREQVSIRIPLFVLAAADVADCTAAVKFGSSGESKLGWSVKLAGTGLGADASAKTSVSEEFSAAHGQRKTVFLPAAVTVEAVAVLEKGKVIGRGHRIDLAGLDKNSAAAGCLLLDPDASPPLGAHLQTYPLAGDASGAIATYQYSYVQGSSTNLSLGVKFKGVELGLTGSVTFERSVELTYALAGGHDYELHRVADADGVIWTV